MTYLERLSWWEKIECHKDNQEDIVKAITEVSKTLQISVYVLLDEDNKWSWIATKTSAFNDDDKVIELIKDEKWDWNPPGYKGSRLDMQLARLNRGSLNSQ